MTAKTFGTLIMTMWRRIVASFKSKTHSSTHGVGLFEAINRRDVDEVARYLLQGVDPNTRRDLEATAETALACAVRIGDLPIVALLIEKGADVNARVIDPWGFDPAPPEPVRPILHIAAKLGDPDIVRCLLDHGADQDLVDDSGTHALDIAVSHGHSEVVSLLLERGAELIPQSGHSGGALSIAALRGWTEIAKMLLAHGAAVDSWGKDGVTPLMQAAAAGHGPTVALLLAAGADRNLENPAGKTAWHLAVESGVSMPLDLLQPDHVDAGCALDSWLMGAVATKDSRAVRELLAKGANPNSSVPGETTPLLRAVRRGAAEIVGVLLEGGASVNTCVASCRTPLLEAAASWDERLDIVRLLIAHGAEVNLADDRGNTPLTEAVLRRHDAVVGALLVAGADVDTMTHFGPALHCAVHCRDEVMVRLLIAHGADVNLPDSVGQTALEAARPQGYREIVALLKRAGARR